MRKKQSLGKRGGGVRPGIVVRNGGNDGVNHISSFLVKIDLFKGGGDQRITRETVIGEKNITHGGRSMSGEVRNQNRPLTPIVRMAENQKLIKKHPRVRDDKPVGKMRGQGMKNIGTTVVCVKGCVGGGSERGKKRTREVKGPDLQVLRISETGGRRRKKQNRENQRTEKQALSSAMPMENLNYGGKCSEKNRTEEGGPSRPGRKGLREIPKKKTPGSNWHRLVKTTGRWGEKKKKKEEEGRRANVFCGD